MSEHEELERFVVYLAGRLQEEGIGERTLSTTVRGGEAFIGSRDRWVLHVVIAGPRVVLSVIDASTGAWTDHAVDSLADLDECFGAVVESVREALDQLTVHRLAIGLRATSATTTGIGSSRVRSWCSRSWTTCRMTMATRFALPTGACGSPAGARSTRSSGCWSCGRGDAAGRTAQLFLDLHGVPVSDPIAPAALGERGCSPRPPSSLWLVLKGA